MDHIGMDLGKKESQIAILTQGGELIEKRMRTERERLRQYFEGRPQAKILMEASTVSEWVARLLEDLGHEVVVADPNYAPMYAQRSRRVKTDKRDALALAEACKLGAYRLAHRTSDEQRHVRAAPLWPSSLRPPITSLSPMRSWFSRFLSSEMYPGW